MDEEPSQEETENQEPRQIDISQYGIWRIFASWHSQLSRNLPPKITVLFTTCTVPTVNFQQSEWAPILVFFSGKLKQASKVTFIIRCDSISGHELVSHQSIFTKSVKVRFVFLCHCQTKLASNTSALPQRRVKSTQSEVDANLKSHFYTSATNQLKLIFGQGCQTKSASNPSVLPQTRLQYTKTPNQRLSPTSKVTFTKQQKIN